MDNRFTRLGLISRLGTVIAKSNKIDLPEGITHCVGLPEQSPVSLPPNVTYMPLNKIIDKGLDDLLKNGNFTKTGIYRSETGEIELHSKTPSFRFVSPRSEGFIMPEGISVTGSAVKVKNISGYASVFVASHNQHSISESRRLLVFHLTDVQNTKATFDSDEMKVWLTSGGLPLLVHRGMARISIKTQMADSTSVWAVEMTGKRIKKMQILRTNGAISFSAETIQDKGTFLAYEVAEK